MKVDRQASKTGTENSLQARVTRSAGKGATARIETDGGACKLQMSEQPDRLLERFVSRAEPLGCCMPTAGTSEAFTYAANDQSSNHRSKTRVGAAILDSENAVD
jgi:hypothetical protein